MKILHFSTWKTGGAAKAAERLSNALSELGHSSKLIHMPSKLPAYFDAAVDKLGSDNNPIFHSYNYFPDNFLKIIRQEKPDLVHLHWIGAGFVRPESLQHCPVPIVWTLHDLWPLLGAEHLPLDQTRMIDGYLPYNRPKTERGLDLNRLVWERKKRSWSNLNLNFIAPSRYVSMIAKKASQLNKRHSLIQIYNPINNQCFAPPSSKNINPHKILIVATNLSIDSNKGLDLLIETLNKIPTEIAGDIKLTIVGLTSTIQKEVGQFKSVEIYPSINEEGELARHYQESTLILIPSRNETLSYVAMESLSCETPVVAFRVGGIPELVLHKQTGYLAKPYDTSDLARGITTILNNPKLRAELGRNAVTHIKENFSKSKIVDAHLKLYNSLLNR